MGAGIGPASGGDQDAIAASRKFKAEALAKLMDMKSAMGVATLDVSTSDLVKTLKDTQATEIAGQIETTKVRVSSVQKETISPQIKKDMIAYLTQLRGDDELDIEQVANEFSTKVDELMVTQMQNVVDRVAANDQAQMSKAVDKVTESSIIAPAKAAIEKLASDVSSQVTAIEELLEKVVISESIDSSGASVGEHLRMYKAREDRGLVELAKQYKELEVLLVEKKQTESILDMVKKQDSQLYKTKAEKLAKGEESTEAEIAKEGSMATQLKNCESRSERVQKTIAATVCAAFDVSKSRSNKKDEQASEEEFKDLSSIAFGSKNKSTRSMKSGARLARALKKYVLKRAYDFPTLGLWLAFYLLTVKIPITSLEFPTCRRIEEHWQAMREGTKQPSDNPWKMPVECMASFFGEVRKLHEDLKEALPSQVSASEVVDFDFDDHVYGKQVEVCGAKYVDATGKAIWDGATFIEMWLIQNYFQSAEQIDEAKHRVNTIKKLIYTKPLGIALPAAIKIVEEAAELETMTSFAMTAKRWVEWVCALHPEMRADVYSDIHETDLRKCPENVDEDNCINYLLHLLNRFQAIATTNSLLLEKPKDLPREHEMHWTTEVEGNQDGCYHCGEHGHIARNCTNGGGGRGGGGRGRAGARGGRGGRGGTRGGGRGGRGRGGDKPVRQPCQVEDCIIVCNDQEMRFHVRRIADVLKLPQPRPVIRCICAKHFTMVRDDKGKIKWKNGKAVTKHDLLIGDVLKVAEAEPEPEPEPDGPVPEIEDVHPQHQKSIAELRKELQEEVDDAKALKKGIQADWDAQKEKDDFDRDQRRIREEMKAEGARELLEQRKDGAARTDQGSRCNGRRTPS